MALIIAHMVEVLIRNHCERCSIAIPRSEESKNNEYRSGKVEGRDYGLPAVNPFGDWDVSDRYAHQSNFSQASVQIHQAGAAAICELIKKAQREGLLI